MLYKNEMRLSRNKHTSRGTLINLQQDELI